LWRTGLFGDGKDKLGCRLRRKLVHEPHQSLGVKRLGQARPVPVTGRQGLRTKAGCENHRRAALRQLVGNFENGCSVEPDVKHCTVNAAPAKQAQGVKWCRCRTKNRGAEFTKIATYLRSDEEVVFDDQDTSTRQIHAFEPAHISPARLEMPWEHISLHRR
jgi:hypothetical protein